MNETWRSAFAGLVVLAATVWAVFLLSNTPPQYAPAAALLTGAILIVLVLGHTPQISGLASRLSCDSYRGCVAWAVSLGGGVVVAFAIVWILAKVTGYNLGSDTTGQTIGLSQTISLPLIVIVGVTLLLIVIALVAFSFSVLGLSSATDALGLPDGSVRAIIALMLLVLFSIVSIFLYNSIASRPLQTLTHVTQGGIDDLRSRAVTIVLQQSETPAASPSAPAAEGQVRRPGAPATGAGNEPTYTVAFRELSGPADDIAKQLIVMLGTLVTAVASFYFGSASTASASAAALGQKPGEPLSTTIGPNPITASGNPQTLMIVGSNLANVTELHLEKSGEPDINASSVKSTDKSISAEITIPKGESGSWAVVVVDGSHAVTIGKVEIAPVAATQPADAATVKDQPAKTGGADERPADSELLPTALAQPGAAIFDNAILASATVPSPINTAFLGHGIFLEYSPVTTLRRYANYKGADPAGATTAQLIERFIQAMRDMHVASVWLQLFSASGALDSTGNGATSELVAALGQASIACVGWGYCYSGNAATDAGLAKHLCDKYGISAFVADVEPGNTVHGRPDSWQPGDFKNLIAGLKGTFGKANLGISTFGTLKGHEDAAKIYNLAINDVAFFAPQIYWYQKSPIAYAQDCIASFRQAGIGNPLVGTAQAYWETGKSGGVTRTTMEAKVSEFVTGFTDWGKLVGLNWYHGGNDNTEASGAMSDAMIKSIAANRLDQKAYATPTAAEAALSV